MIWDHMGDRDARRPGFCAKFDRGRDGMGPGAPNPLNKLKISVFKGGPGSWPYSPCWPGVGWPYWPGVGWPYWPELRARSTPGGVGGMGGAL